MTSPDARLEALRRQLERRGEELDRLDATAEAATATVELDQTRVGRLSRMDALQGQALAQATRDRQRLERQRIRAALRRLDEGEFGYCMACDEPIAAARLDADPTHTLCIGCASAAERR